MFLSLSLVQLLVQLPMLVVLVVGFGALSARRRRLPRRAVTLGSSGCAVLLLATLVSGGWAAMLPRLLTEVDLSSNIWGVLTFVVGMVQVVLYASGIALLLAALLSSAAPAPAADTGSAGTSNADHPDRSPRAAAPGTPAAGGWSGPPPGGTWNAPPATAWQAPPGPGNWNAAPHPPPPDPGPPPPSPPPPPP